MMTFAQLKKELLIRTAKEEVCPDFQSVLVSTNETDLITAGKNLGPWSYLSQMLDDTLIAEFTEANLNAQGIYANGTFTITNPSFDTIYIYKDAVVNLTLSGNNKCNIIHMGTGLLTANLSDSAYADVKCYLSSLIQINSTLTSILKCQLTDKSTATIIQSNDAVAQVHALNSSSLNITTNDDSISVVKTFGNSDTVYFQNDTSYLNIIQSQNSTVNGSGV